MFCQYAFKLDDDSSKFEAFRLKYQNQSPPSDSFKPKLSKVRPMWQLEVCLLTFLLKITTRGCIFLEKRRILLF